MNDAICNTHSTPMVSTTGHDWRCPLCERGVVATHVTHAPAGAPAQHAESAIEVRPGFGAPSSISVEISQGAPEHPANVTVEMSEPEEDTK